MCTLDSLARYYGRLALTLDNAELGGVLVMLLGGCTCGNTGLSETVPPIAVVVGFSSAAVGPSLAVPSTGGLGVAGV